MEVKDFIMVGVGLLISIISYAYLRDLKAIKESLDTAVDSINNNADKNIEAHKEIWVEVHRIDKEQSETRTIIDRCKSCSGD